MSAMADSSNASKTTPVGQNVLQLLRSNGWGTGFSNPFSNDENKALEDKLEQLQRKSQALRRDLENTTELANGLKQHETNLRIDIGLVQGMVTAKEAHLNHEKTINSQAEKDHAFIVRDHTRLKNLLKDLMERNRSHLINFEKRQKDLSSSMQMVEENRNLIQFFRQKEHEMEDEMNQISRFKSTDTGEIQRVHKHLLKMEKINRDLRFSLEKNLGSTVKASDHYRRLCLEFRQAHRKRKEMLLLWRATLAAVRARDDDLRDMASEYYELREQLRTELNTHECLVSFLNRRREEMEEVEYRSKYHEIEIRKVGELIERLKSQILSLKTDHVHLTSTIQKLTLRNYDVRKQIELLRNEIEDGEKREVRLKSAVSELWENRMKVMDIAKNQGNLVKELDGLIDAEEARYHKLESEGVLIRKYLFEKTNEKCELEQNILNANTRMSLIHRIFNRLHGKEFANTTKIAQGQSQLYRIDLDISTLEIKISRIMNSTVEPRFFSLQLKGERLRTRNAKITVTNNFVAKEADRISITLQKLMDDIEVQRESARNLDISVNEARLTCADVQRLSVGLVDDLKQLKLQHSLLKITVSRLSSSVLGYGGKIFNLAMMRNIFNTAVADRRSEIEFHSTLVRKKIVVLKKEIAFIEHSNYRTNCVSTNLKLKFEMLSGIRVEGNKSQDQDANLFDEIKAIYQERRNLARSKAKWQDQIEQDKKEVEGLSNVLETLKASNEAYKMSLTPATKTGEDRQLNELEGLEKRVFVYRNRCKRHVESLETRGEELKKELGVAKADIQKARAEADDKMLDISTSKNEAQYLRARISRWDQLISRVSTDEESRLEIGIEMEIKIKMLEEKYETAMRKTLALMKKDPHIRKTIYFFLQKHGMVGQFLDHKSLKKPKQFKKYWDYGEEYDTEGVELKVVDLETMTPRGMGLGKIAPKSMGLEEMGPEEAELEDMGLEFSGESASLGALERDPCSAHSKSLSPTASCT